VPLVQSLRRFLLVVKAEEEQAQAALESALAQLRTLQNALHFAQERERVGRQLVSMSTESGDALDRLAALEEIAAAVRTKSALQPRIAKAMQETAMRRDAFLAKRLEHKQTETLVMEAEAQELLQDSRRSQQQLDEWYLGHLIRRPGSVESVACELDSGIEKDS
jgi:hypothetical protein